VLTSSAVPNLFEVDEAKQLHRSGEPERRIKENKPVRLDCCPPAPLLCSSPPGMTAVMSWAQVAGDEWGGGPAVLDSTDSGLEDALRRGDLTRRPM
jgi:hypothetical protein